MKILVVSNLYSPNILGGAEKTVEILAENFASSGHSVTVITTIDPKEIQYERQINGVTVIYTPEKNIYWNFHAKKNGGIKKLFWHFIDLYNIRYNKVIGSLINKIRPDIVFTNNLGGFSVSIWDIAHKQKIPVVHCAHDYYLLCPKSEMFNSGKNCDHICWKCKLMTIIKRIKCSKVDAFVSVSKFVMNIHQRYINLPGQKCFVVYNPIDSPFEIRSPQCVSTDSFIFGYVGRIDEKKGCSLLCQTFNEISEKLMIFGKGESEYCHKLAKMSNSNISFNGFHASEEIYPKINVLIVPSLWREPFGRIVIEANSFGIPVIASRSGGLEELIVENVNGLLFDPQNTDDLKNKISFIKTNYSKFISTENTRRTKSLISQYSHEIITSNYIRLFERLIEEKS